MRFQRPSVSRVADCMMPRKMNPSTKPVPTSSTTAGSSASRREKLSMRGVGRRIRYSAMPKRKPAMLTPTCNGRLLSRRPGSDREEVAGDDQVPVHDAHLAEGHGEAKNADQGRQAERDEEPEEPLLCDAAGLHDEGR